MRKTLCYTGKTHKQAHKLATSEVGKPTGMKYSKLPTKHIHEEKDNVHLLEGRNILIAFFYTFLIGNMSMVVWVSSH